MFYHTAKRCRKCADKDRIQHGQSDHPLRHVWSAMKQRCYNAKSPEYINYGARGIKVSPVWKDAFWIFFQWCTNNGYQKGLYIDRKDNDGDYSPENCRFTSQTIQSRNTRKIYKHNTSGYRGVCKPTNKNFFVAGIKVSGKRNHIGCFKSAIDAAIAYDEYIESHNLEHTKNF